MMFNKLCKGLGLLVTAGLLLLQSAGIAEAGVLKVGAKAYPYAEILTQAQPVLVQQGVELQIVKYSDDFSQEHMPLLDLLEGKIDATFHQSEYSRRSFTKEHGLKIEPVCSVFLEPLAIYSAQVKSVADAWPGSQVIIPNNDYTGRALMLLQDMDILTLRKGAVYNADVEDIERMNRPFKIIVVDPTAMAANYQYFQLAVLDYQQAMQAKLEPSKNALYFENGANPFAVIVAVRDGEQKREDIQKLVAALHAPNMADFINYNYEGHYLAAFSTNF